MRLQLRAQHASDAASACCRRDLPSLLLKELTRALAPAHCWLQGLGTSYEKRLCDARIEDTHTNPSPIYGDGFRAAYRAYRDWGLMALVEFVVQNRRFP